MGGGDLIPDEWESRFGLNPDSPLDALLDEDEEGFTAGDEYNAGTDPTDPDSYLKVETISKESPVQVTFQAASNKTYSIQYSEALPAANWSKLADVVAAATNRTITVQDPASASGRYYRLVTPRMGE
jgi:hypothetical protein